MNVSAAVEEAREKEFEEEGHSQSSSFDGTGFVFFAEVAPPTQGRNESTRCPAQLEGEVHAEQEEAEFACKEGVGLHCTIGRGGNKGYTRKFKVNEFTIQILK